MPRQVQRATDGKAQQQLVTDLESPESVRCRSNRLIERLLSAMVRRRRAQSSQQTRPVAALINPRCLGRTPMARGQNQPGSNASEKSWG